jgi:hypothetical protein
MCSLERDFMFSGSIHGHVPHVEQTRPEQAQQTPPEVPHEARSEYFQQLEASVFLRGAN